MFIKSAKGTTPLHFSSRARARPRNFCFRFVPQNTGACYAGYTGIYVPDSSASIILRCLRYTRYTAANSLQENEINNSVFIWQAILFFMRTILYSITHPKASVILNITSMLTWGQCLSGSLEIS